MYMPWQACGSQKGTCGSCSLLLPCGTQGSNTGHQAWQQATLPAEPSCWPRLSFKSGEIEKVKEHNGDRLEEGRGQSAGTDVLARREGEKFLPGESPTPLKQEKRKIKSELNLWPDADFLPLASLVWMIWTGTTTQSDGDQTWRCCHWGRVAAEGAWLGYWLKRVLSSYERRGKCEEGHWFLHWGC